MSTRRRGRPRNVAAHAQIIEAATERFTSEGYERTTMGAIAEQAGVAVQTIYSAFGSKLGVLSAAHDVAVARDDDPVPLLERPWVEDVSRAPSAPRACGVAVDYVTGSTATVAPVYTVIQSAAADPDVADLLSRLHDQRRTFSRELAQLLLQVPGADPAADPDRLTDILYATLCVETYNLFVIECGWSIEDWRQWARETITRETAGG